MDSSGPNALRAALRVEACVPSKSSEPAGAIGPNAFGPDGGRRPSRGLRRPSGRPAEALDEPQRDGRRLAEGGEQASGAASEESGRGAKGRPPAERRLGKIPPTAGAGNGVAACISAKTALRAGSRAPTCREKPEDPPSGWGSSNKRGAPGRVLGFQTRPRAATGREPGARFEWPSRKGECRGRAKLNRRWGLDSSKCRRNRGCRHISSGNIPT